MDEYSGQSRPKGTKTVYRALWYFRMTRSRLLPLIPVLLLMSGVLLGELLRSPALFEKVIAGLLLYATCIACWDVLKWVVVTRLITSPEGMEYFVFGYRGFAYWQDIAYFGYQKSPKGEDVWGIVLHRDVALTPTRGDVLFSFFRPIPPVRLHSFIPLSTILWIEPGRKRGHNYREDLREFKVTSLGQDLLQYAPHLFEESSQKKKD